MPENVKFLAVNIRPTQFLRPPTESLQIPYSVNARLQEDAINSAAIITAKHAPELSQRSLLVAPKLQVASDIEIILFSNQSTPGEDNGKKEENNPNYTRTHLQAVSEFNQLLRTSRTHGGLKEVLYDDGEYPGRISTEIRTIPTDVMGYIKSIAQIGEWFRSKAGKYGINPAIWSQHLHLSLVDPSSGVNLLEDDLIRETVGKGIVDIYHRAIPLLNLPEGTNNTDSYAISVANDIGVLTKGGYRSSNGYPGPIRIEGRLNSSEFAADPILNLLMHLIGIKRGLMHIGDHTKIDEDYPLMNSGSLQDAYFTFGQGYTTFQNALERLLTDEVLSQEIPHELLSNTHKIIQVYPQISQGELTLSAARERAYDIVQHS
jgi:hypothetical protein